MDSSSSYAPSASPTPEPESQKDQPSPALSRDGAALKRKITTKQQHKKKAKALRSNVYEASSSLLNSQGSHILINNNNSTSNPKPASADELIARREHGAVALQEIENENIPTESLPDSDLLKAIHQYASDFYEAKGWGEEGYGMMDETAMLAVGVLLEETMREMLGKDGDGGELAFLERDEEWCGGEHKDVIEEEEGEAVAEGSEVDESAEGE